MIDKYSMNTMGQVWIFVDTNIVISDHDENDVHYKI